MKHRMMKAWLIGVSILLAIFLIWGVLLRLNVYSQWTVAVLWASPTIAAFVTSYLGPNSKFLLGTSLAIPSAFLAVVFNVVSQLSGAAADFPGLKGGLILFVLVLITSAVLAAVGSMMGYFASSKS